MRFIRSIDTLYKKLGIRYKIAVVFGIILLVFCTAIITSNYYLERMLKETDRLAVSSVMVENSLEVRRHEKNYLIRGDTMYRDLVYGFLGKLMVNIEEYKRYSFRKRSPMAGQLSKAIEAYRKSFEAIGRQEMKTGTRKETEDLIKTGRMLQETCKNFEKSSMQMISRSRRAIIFIRVFAVVLFLAAGLFTFTLVSIQVVRPLQKLQQLSRDMGKEGVLNQGQIHYMDRIIKQISSQDEIGELARSYRMMVIRYYNSYLGLQDKMKEVEELSKIKTEFASMVSHELRTPLTAIKEVVDLLYYEISGQLAKDQKEFLKVAKRNIDRLTRLINDILDFSKLSSRKMPMKIEDVSINDIIDSVLHIYKVVIEKKDVHLMTHTRASKGVFVRVDSDRVNQVLTNLLGNAIKFTEKGSITVSTSLVKSDTMRINVKDTGEGIAPEKIPHLFQPFTRLEEANNQKKKEGTGLGLAICKLIVEQLGGVIGVESKQGEGSTFFFTLPLSHPS